MKFKHENEIPAEYKRASYERPYKIRMLRDEDGSEWFEIFNHLDEEEMIPNSVIEADPKSYNGGIECAMDECDYCNDRHEKSLERAMNR